MGVNFGGKSKSSGLEVSLGVPLSPGRPNKLYYVQDENAFYKWNAVNSQYDKIVMESEGTPGSGGSLIIADTVPVVDGNPDMLYFIKSENAFYKWTAGQGWAKTIYSYIADEGGNTGGAGIEAYPTENLPSYPNKEGQIVVDTTKDELLIGIADTEISMPTFTDYITGSQRVTLTGTEYNPATYQAWKIFDKTTTSYFRGWSPTNTAAGTILTIDIGKIVQVVSYSLQANSTLAGQAKAWRFEGSKDNQEWTTLDTRIEQTGWAEAEIRSFTIQTGLDVEFRFFRLCVDEGNTAAYVIIGEMDIRYKPLSWRGLNPNKPALDKISEVDGKLYFNNQSVQAQAVTSITSTTFNLLAGATQVLPMNGERIIQAWKLTTNDIIPFTTNLFTDGSRATASSVNSTNTPNKAFDDPSLVTYWHALTSANEWIAYDFGAGNEKNLCSIQLIYSASGYGPKNVKIQWSDDGVAWNDAYIGLLTTGTTNTINFSPVGSKRFWRVYAVDGFSPTVLRIKTMYGFEGSANQVKKLITAADNIDITHDSIGNLSIKNNGASPVDIRINILA